MRFGGSFLKSLKTQSYQPTNQMTRTPEHAPDLLEIATHSQ